MRLKKLSPEAEQALVAYSWPGNVRELRNLCERLVIMGGDPISAANLPSDIRLRVAEPRETATIRLPAGGRPMTLKQFKSSCEKEFLERVLERHNWNYVSASDELDIQRTYLHRKIQALGISKPGE